MATFAKKSFDAVAYLKNRPTYTKSFIEHVIAYAAPAKGAVAIDLGCGPGQATSLLASSGRFSKVIGVDPGEGMIHAARDSVSALTDGSTSSPIEYRVGSAEDLSWAKDSSVDLITAGQAAHWFDHSTVYEELLRILKPGGTVAYWGYSYLFLPEHGEESTKAIYDFGLGKLGPYWEQGRNGPESLYDVVPFPSATGSKPQGWDTSTFKRQKFDQTSSSAYVPLNGDLPGPPSTEHLPICMQKSMTLHSLREQFKTWSSVHTYMQKHKPEKHVVDQFIDDKLRSCLGKAGQDENSSIEVQWPLGLMLMKKSAAA